MDEALNFPDLVYAYNVIKELALHGNGVAHHAKYEYKWTKIKMGVAFKFLCCTQVLSYVQDPNRTWHADPRSVGLKPMIWELFGIDSPDYEDVIDFYNAPDFSFVPMEGAVPYGCGDADYCLRIKDSLWAQVQSALKPIFDLEMKLVPVIGDQELWGVGLDPARLAADSEVLDDEILELKLKCFDLMGLEVKRGPDDSYIWPFDLNSPAKVSEHLFGVMNIPSTDLPVGKEGRVSASKKSLEQVRKKYPVIDAVLLFKEAAHMKNNFAGKLQEYVNPVTGLIHGSCNQTGAPTGRCSHSQPNLAQLPKHRD